MIHIVDAMMGMGKTSAAIRFMNEHAGDRRFLYITPYIDETERICNACPDLHFATPTSGLAEFNYRKSDHFKELVSNWENVALSHKLFAMCDNDAVATIKDKDYTIIIDEVVDVFEPLPISGDDIDILQSSGWLVGDGSGKSSDYTYYEQAADKKYTGGRFAELFMLAKSHRLINTTYGDGKKKFFYWSLHKELFTMSSEVFVLTYLFEGAPMKAYLQINGLEYDTIGVERDGAGGYHFSERRGVASYAAHLSDMIHICDAKSLNDIGNYRTALSRSWWDDNRNHIRNGKIEQLRRNLYNFYRHYSGDADSDKRLWSTFDGCASYIRGKGYYRSNIAVNARATNAYRDRTALAYCANIFVNPVMARYFEQEGATIDKDLYALSTLVQWIWRSAIRDGNEVHLYLPSKRMRTLLCDWIQSVERQCREYEDVKRCEENGGDGIGE